MSKIAAGFSDAVHDSQHCFRKLLTAMSEPGTLVELNLMAGFGSMMPASTQVLLALADNSTPLWLSKQFESDVAVLENLNFHLGCSIVTQQQQANFALIAAQDVSEFDWQMAQFDMGSEEYPDRSTTVIVEVKGLLAQPSLFSTTLKLSGPGIKSDSILSIELLSPSVLQAILLLRQSSHFPLGLDFIFVSEQKIVALPRSTTVEII